MATKKNNIETRKTEKLITTSNPREMLNMYLAEPLRRGWKEDCVDEETGEVVTVDRYEMIADRGTLLDKSMIAEIQFYMREGSTKEVKVSNQRRAAFALEGGYLSPWMVTARIGDKNRKFLLYALSIEMAYEIATDYIELNYLGSFTIAAVKELTWNTILKDTLQKPDETDADTYEERKFYQIEVKITRESGEMFTTFIVETANVDRAMMLITDYTAKQIKENKPEGGPAENFGVMLETAKILPCSAYIPMEFSQAYITLEGDQK